MATTGHESEAINVQGLKASLQKLKTDHIDGKADKATTLAGYGITDAYTKSETYTKTEVNGLVDTPHQNYVTVSATSQTTAATDVLPSSGQAADTIYRVSNWDGSASSGAGAFDVTKYSEYAWDDQSNPNKYVFLCVKTAIGEVFDISVYNNNATYADLATALGVDGANVPADIRRGGMSVKFVHSSDHKYVQYRLMADTFSITPSDWQGVDDEPRYGSDNLVKSGGVKAAIDANNVIEGKTFYVTDGDGNVIAKIDKDGVHSVDFKYGAEGNSIKRQLEGIFSSDILFGKKICCCGDSITLGADIGQEGIAQESDITVYQSDTNGNFTQVTSDFKKTYGYQIAERHNMTFYNAGVSGSTIQGIVERNGFSLENGRYTKLPDELDIITLFFGWNDNAAGTLGTIDDTTNDTFYGGYNVVLPYLINKYPLAKIIIIVPFGTTPKHRDAVRLLANKWGISVFDMYQGGTPLFFGKEDYVGVDGDIIDFNRTKFIDNYGTTNFAHPNYNGHVAIGDMLEQFLLSGVVYPKRTDTIIEGSKELPTSAAVFNAVKAEEARAKAAEDTKLNYAIADDKFRITDANGYIICQIDASGVHSVNIDDNPNTIDDDKLIITDSQGYVIAKVDSEGVHAPNIFEGSFDDNKLIITDNSGYIICQIDANGVHSAKDKHAVACMVLSEAYYPTSAPIRDGDGNVTYAEVMFETGVAGSISIIYANGNSSIVSVVYGDYNYTITINRDSDGNVETVNIQ